jgi:thiol-disulfide isomerase/thioredoxin
MKLLTHKFLLVIFYLLSTVISYSAEQTNFKNLIVYSEAKKLKNIEFKNNFNEIIRLNDYRGKLVILNFWATWCVPCREEMLHLDMLQSVNKLENLKIFPINVGKEKIEKVEKFFLELKIKNLDIYFDDTVKLPNLFSLRGIPTSVIINKNGEEFARIMGAVNFTDKKFVEWLRKYN